MRTVAAAMFFCAAVHSVPADACSMGAPPNPSFFRFEASRGGVWWVHGILPADDAVELVSVDGAQTITTVVVSRGPASGVALRVPDDAPVGVSFTLPPWVTWPEPDALRVLADVDVPAEGAVPAPDFSVELRETRTSYVGVLASPIDPGCGQPFGFWNHGYTDRPYVVMDVPDGFVLDATLRADGADAFAPVSSANEVFADAREPGPVDEFAAGPADADFTFVAHARLRRIADGAVGPVVSVDVAVDDEEVTRLEWVGCSAARVDARGAPASAALLLVVGTLARRRRRCALRHVGSTG